MNYDGNFSDKRGCFFFVQRLKLLDEKKGRTKKTNKKNLKIRNSDREIVINQDPRRAQKKGIVRLSGRFKSNIFSSDDDKVMKDVDLSRGGKQRGVLLGSTQI